LSKTSFHRPSQSLAVAAAEVVVVVLVVVLALVLVVVVVVVVVIVVVVVWFIYSKIILIWSLQSWYWESNNKHNK
jgi:fatty acid desaturase